MIDCEREPDEPFARAVDQLHSIAVLQLVGSDRPADEILAALAWMNGETDVVPAFIAEHVASDSDT